jgi:hypothetical protein
MKSHVTYSTDAPLTIKQRDNKNKFVVGMFSRAPQTEIKDKRHTENRKGHAIYLRLAISYYVFLPFFVIYSYIHH